MIKHYVLFYTLNPTCSHLFIGKKRDASNFFKSAEFVIVETHIWQRISLCKTLECLPLAFKIKTKILKRLFMVYLLGFCTNFLLFHVLSSSMSSRCTHLLIPGPGMLLPTVPWPASSLIFFRTQLMLPLPVKSVNRFKTSDSSFPITGASALSISYSWLSVGPQ